MHRKNLVDIFGKAFYVKVFVSTFLFATRLLSVITHQIFMFYSVLIELIFTEHCILL